MHCERALNLGELPKPAHLQLLFKPINHRVKGMAVTPEQERVWLG